MNWLQRFLPERWSLKSAIVAAYLAFTVATSSWYFVAAATGSPEPDIRNGHVHAIAGPRQVGFARDPTLDLGQRGWTAVYVSSPSYVICLLAAGNWVLIVLAGLWQFLRRV